MAFVSNNYNWSDGSATKGNTYGGGYNQNDGILNAYRKMAEDARKQAEQQKQLGIKRLEGQETDALQQAYIQKSKAEQALPQQIAMSGGGGLSETSALGLNADYGQNRVGIQKERMNLQNQFESDVDGGLNSTLSGLDNAYASRLAQLEQNRIDEQRRQQDMTWQREQWENQNNQWNQQFEYGKQQDTLNRQATASRSSSSGSAKNPFEISSLNQPQQNNAKRLETLKFKITNANIPQGGTTQSNIAREAAIQNIMMNMLASGEITDDEYVKLAMSLSLT